MPTRPLFRLFLVFSFKQYNFYNKMWKMSIQYTAAGFEPKTSWHESSPITTRTESCLRLTFWKIGYFLHQYLVTLAPKLFISWTVSSFPDPRRVSLDIPNLNKLPRFNFNSHFFSLEWKQRNIWDSLHSKISILLSTSKSVFLFGNIFIENSIRSQRFKEGWGR